MSKKTLQNFTEPSKKIKTIIDSGTLTKKEFESLTKDERKEFQIYADNEMKGKSGVERLHVANKWAVAFDRPTKNILWANNHQLIIGQIDELMKEYNRMPNTLELAQATGLSRQTIHNHLTEFQSNPFYEEHMEQFKIMIPVLLSRLYKMAVGGDVKAAKLYFSAVGGFDNTIETSKPKTQNNYIQINNTVLSQEQVSSLTEEQIEQLERILKD